MLDTTTKKRIDDCRDILVGKLPDPKSQIEQITIGLIYKFMDDMDKEAIELGGEAKFFSGDYEKYAWDALFDSKVAAVEMLRLYAEAIESMEKNPEIPQLFRDIFKNAYLPYRDPETLKLFLKTIGEFEYTHSEKLGDAFEYLLSVMGSQGDAGQFRTPRHIIDFLVAAVDPSKADTILDPACGTAGFLISAFKHIKNKNKKGLTPDEQKKLIKNFSGYDISPDMVRLSLVNLYLHGFANPHIWEYDTLSSEERWNDSFDVILANPPFMSPKGGIRPHKKFTIGSNRSEVLFVDYIAEHLNPKGRAGIIVPEGVIFQSGKAYKELRKMLVDNYLYAVVSLPSGIFNPYSGVKTSILLMDKEFAKSNNKILFVKVDNDGFNLGAQRSAVKGGQLNDALECIQQFKEGEMSEELMAHAVVKSIIAENGDYNLSGERYKILAKTDSDWSFEELGKNIDFISGLTLSIPDSMDENGTPIISMNSILEDGTLVKKGIRNIKLPSKKITYLEKGDLLFNWRNGSKHLVGKTAYFDWEGDYVFASFLLGIRPHKDKYNSKFLWSVLNYCRSQGLYMQFMRRNVNGLFNREELKIFKVPLPPLSIQEEIVAEIAGYQKIIDGAQLVVENYKPKIDIDPEWEMVELGEISNNFQYGSSKKSNDSGNIVCLRMGNIQNGEIDWSDLKFAPDDEEFEKYSLSPGDVLFNRTNSPIHVGKTGIYRGDREAVFAGYLIRINYQKDKIIGEYLNYCLNTKEAKEFCQRVKTDGINQSNINAKILATFQIPLPTLEIQEQIVIQIEKEQELVNANKQLIEIFEQKIKDRIAKVWGASTSLSTSSAELSTQERKTSAEEISPIAAEPSEEYKKDWNRKFDQ